MHRLARSTRLVKLNSTVAHHTSVPSVAVRLSGSVRYPLVSLQPRTAPIRWRADLAVMHLQV